MKPDNLKKNKVKIINNKKGVPSAHLYKSQSDTIFILYSLFFLI